VTVLIVIILSAICGCIAGYIACYIGTWAKLHRQESAIRALVNDVAVMRDLDGEQLPGEWVQMQLESMLTWEEFA